MVADGDNEGSSNAPLFKYTFKENKYELINRLGAADVEAIVLSLDGTVLYGTNNGQLGIIDPTKGIEDSFTPVNPSSHRAGMGRGSLGRIRIGDIDSLAFDPTDGTLYGTERHGDGADGQLDLLIKLNTGTGRIIHDGFGPGVDYLVIDSSSVGASDIDDIAIDAAGQLFGIAGNSGGGGNDHLIAIDKHTAAVTDAGALYNQEQNLPIQDMEGLTFYNSRILFGTTGMEFESSTGNTLYRINKDNGRTQPIVELDRNFNGLIPGDFEAIDCFPACR